jgi:HD-GYP domain-containing protein (c-di-GMP phosphodiesterase class II)
VRERAFADMTGVIQLGSRLRRGEDRARAWVRAGASSQAGAKAGVDDHDRSGTRVSWALGATIAVALAAGAGAALASSTAVTVACLVALSIAAAAVGWLAGEQHRTKLQREIEARSLELRKTMTELEVAQAETVRRLSMAVEFRDEDTGAHIERIGRFSTLLAEQIGLEQELCERMSHAAPLHDVGKVAIPDAILLKPGKLTAEERAIVETHAEEGHRLLKGSSSAILDMAATIALSHHEKWDGSGYPRGVAGESIPIEGRVVAIADVFDALTSDRVYRKAFSVQEAVQMMREERGKHFDPVLLDAFMEVLEQSGPDAREQVRADPAAVAESALETFATALERGEAEPAESAIAQAMEDGLGAGDVQGEVIEPTLRRLAELRERGQLDAEHEQLAMTIVRRVLATLRRYLLSGREDEDVLVRIERSVEQVEEALRSAAVG